MRRREFISLLGGATAAWSLAARAQQGERVRHIGVLMNKATDDPEGRSEVSAFEEALQNSGWKLGANLQIDYRWGAGDSSRYPIYATELVTRAPDVLLAEGGTIVGALQRVTRDVPIVFFGTTDPVSRGLVASLSRPGATPQVSCSSILPSAANGSSCSSKSHQASHGRRSFVIPVNSPESVQWRPFRPLRRRLVWT